MKAREFTTNYLTEWIEANPQSMSNDVHEIQMDINSSDWFNYIENNWSSEKHGFKVTSHFASFVDREKSEHESQLRYDKSVLFRKFMLNAGYTADSTKQHEFYQRGDCDLFRLLGRDNFNKLNLDLDTCVFRILINMPGTFLPIHYDYVGIEKSQKRYSVMIAPYSIGHFLFVGHKMLYNWNVGTCYDIKFPHLHGSGNCGILAKISLTITGDTNA